MKPRTVIALLSAFLVLCVAYWLAVRTETQEKLAAVEAKRLFDVPPDAFTSITIEREGEKPTTGVRDGNAWRIAEPYPVRPDNMMWERVSKNIAELRNERTIEEGPADLSVYKLDAPRLTVRAKTTDGEQTVIRFGAMDPTQKFRYAVYADTVFLVNPDQFFELDRDLTALRDRDLVKTGKAGITRIEFTPMRASKTGTAPDGRPVVEEAVTVVAQRNDKGEWEVLAPEPGTADQQMLNTLAGEMQFAKGRDYVDAPESLDDYRLDPPQARVRVQSGADGPIQTLYFGGYDRENKERGGVYVMQEGSPAVFVVDAAIVVNFPNAGPDAWREKRIVTRQGSDITSLRYQAGPQQFLLVKDPERGWRLKEPIERETDQAAVSRFIGELLSLKGTSTFVEQRPEFGLDAPAITITLTYEDLADPAKIIVGARVPDQERYYVTQDSGVVTTLSQDEVDALAVTPKDFYDRRLISFNPSDAVEVDLTIDGARYVFTRGEQAWTVKEPADKVWESQDDMQAILDAFKSLSAASIDVETAPEDLALFGLDKPALIITITTKGPSDAEPTSTTLRFGELCPDDDHLRYAMLDGRPHVYRVRQSPVSAVRNALRGVVGR